MADYKDIITGTLSNIVGKVKEVADSGAIKDIYEHGANRAKSYGQMAKLSLEINGDSEELKRVYADRPPVLRPGEGRSRGLLCAPVRAGRRAHREHQLKAGTDPGDEGRIRRRDRSRRGRGL